VLKGWFVNIESKYSVLLTALLMVVTLDTAMSFTMTSVMTGWTSGFIQRFAGAWLIGLLLRCQQVYHNSTHKRTCRISSDLLSKNRIYVSIPFKTPWLKL